MKNILFAIVCILMLYSCSQNKSTFSTSELALLKNIGFEQELLTNLKHYVKNEFVQFEISEPGYSIDQNGEKQKSGVEKRNGISFEISENRSDDIILKYKDELRKNGYLIFLSESGYKSPSTLSIIKSNDQFDILRIQKTDGINFDIENQDVIAKLQEWDKTYDLEILGADYDWVDFIINKPVANPKLFSEEVYEFCPDAVDQGVGDIEALEKIITEHQRLFLWWD